MKRGSRHAGPAQVLAFEKMRAKMRRAEAAKAEVKGDDQAGEGSVGAADEGRAEGLGAASVEGGGTEAGDGDRGEQATEGVEQVEQVESEGPEVEDLTPGGLTRVTPQHGADRHVSEASSLAPSASWTNAILMGLVQDVAKALDVFRAKAGFLAEGKNDRLVVQAEKSELTVAQAWRFVHDRWLWSSQRLLKLLAGAHPATLAPEHLEAVRITVALLDDRPDLGAQDWSIETPEAGDVGRRILTWIEEVRQQYIIWAIRNRAKGKGQDLRHKGTGDPTVVAMGREFARVDAMIKAAAQAAQAEKTTEATPAEA